MIKALEEAVDKLRALPEAQQRRVAKLIERIIAAEHSVYRLSDEERRLVREGLDELDRGEVATEAEVRAVYDKYRAMQLEKGYWLQVL